MSSEIKQLREFGKFRLDVQKKILWFKDEPVGLPLKEVELLCVLTEQSGEVVTKDELLERIWADSFVEESNLSRHVYRLRKVFAELGESEDLIQTVPRRGYRFTAEISEIDPSELVIERHSVSRTLIETLEESELSNPTSLAPVNHPRPTRVYAVVAIGLVMLLSGFGIHSYQTSSGNSSASQPLRSIAVLPLRSVDAKSDDQALSLGFADALITSLGRNQELKVISASAISRYVDNDREPIEVGRELGVDGVIDGTLQRANGTLRVTLRLLRVADTKQLWSRSFDESENLIFRLQDSMAEETAHGLSVSFHQKERSKLPTENLNAYHLYLEGQYLFRRRQPKGSRLFKQATQLDPTFAKAWAGLAATYAMGAAMAEAEATINVALQLEPELAEAHAVRGFIKMFLDWDWPEAEKSLNRAVELDPNSVEAHHWRGVYLSFRGRLDEAKAEIKRALELDPVSPVLLADLGQLHYFVRELEQAEQLCLRALSIEPDYRFAKYYLRSVYELQGRKHEAFELQRSLHCEQDFGETKDQCLETLTRAYLARGPEGVYDKLVHDYRRLTSQRRDHRDWRAVAFYFVSRYSVQLGDKEEAVSSLRRSLETKARFDPTNFLLPYIIADPAFDAVRDELGFKQILHALRLEHPA